MCRWLLRVLAGGLLPAACTSPSNEELLEGKACTADDLCAEGYTCNEDHVCVREGSSTIGGSGGGGGSGASPSGEGGEGAMPATGGDGGTAGQGAMPATGGDAGSGALFTGGVAGTGATPTTGGDAGSGAVPTGGSADTGGTPTGGSAGTGGAPTGGSAGAGGSVSCAGPVEDCTAIETALRHRYSFDEGPGAVDSVSAADGTLERGATLTGDGAVELSGTSSTTGGYVDLPNGIVSALNDATFEAWIDWDGVGGDWQRVFDFGEAMLVMGTSCVAGGASASEGSTGVCGRTYLSLSANTEGFPTGPPRASFLTQPGTPTNDSLSINSSTNLPVNTTQHLAVVVNDSADRLALYRNGLPDGSITFTSSLSEINDINNWLGRSQFTGDPTFDGQILEFRIYAAALTDSQIATSFAEGTDPEFLE